MLKLKHSSIRMDSAALLLLFTLFTATAVMMVMMGAKQYRYVVNLIDTHYENRNVASYVREKIRQNNEYASVSISNIEGVEALRIETTLDGKVYETYIYYKEGWLYELLVTDTRDCSFNAGQPIMEVKDFKMTIKGPKLLQISYTDLMGQEQFIDINLLSIEESD